MSAPKKPNDPVGMWGRKVIGEVFDGVVGASPVKLSLE